ncbi:MAG: serine hydrolase, partial [Chloroflexota bacterium]
HLEAGLQPTWRDLATLMMIVSDNTATNLLLHRLGLARVQEWIESAGLADTRLQRVMMDQRAALSGRDNLASPADMLTLLTRIREGTCVSPEASAHMRR